MAEKDNKEMKETKEKELKEGQKTEDKTLFTITTQNVWKITTVVLAIIVIALLIQNAKYRGAQQEAGDTTDNTGSIDELADTIGMTVYDDDVVKGSADAKVTVIIYSDPSCPFCAAAAGGTEMVAYMKQKNSNYEPAVLGIIKDYVDTGKVRLVFRYFPGHGKGVDAMKMLLCANEQGKFWELHDVFFDNQKLMESGDSDGLAELAKGIVQDTASFDTCRQSGRYDAKLTTDTQRGVEMGVQGTPAFVINGKIVVGAQPYSVFQTALDAALAE